MSLLKFAEAAGIYKGAIDFVTKITLLVIAFYAPLKGLILTILLLVVLDLVTGIWARSEEHTSELQSLMRISYAVFCLKKKITNELHKLYNQITVSQTQD